MLSYEEMVSKTSASTVAGFISLNGIKTESGKPIDFHTHRYLVDIYADESKKLAVMKAAQIGLSTLQIFRSLWRAYYMKLDIIYVLPSFTDIKDFVAGKVNRIVDQNPKLQEWVSDKDSIEQKHVGTATIYYRGSWAERQALMISADELCLDEYDRCDQSVLETYESRLQHSKHGYISVFSNPSTPGRGVHRFYEQSDKKIWHITHTCGQSFHFEENCVNYDKEIYECPHCKGEITDEQRRMGFWQKTAEGEWSGYKIPLWIHPDIPASKIVDYKKNKSADYFANFVAGEPYISVSDAISVEQVLANCSSKVNPLKSRIIIGVDTGLPIYYTCLNKDGVFFHDKCDNYKPFRDMLKKWDNAILVSDQGGDLIGIRELQEEFPGRVFLAYYRKDRKSVDTVQWGQSNEFGKVVIDRNKMISLMVEQLKDPGRILLNGTPEDWRPWAEHFANMYRELVVSPDKPQRDSSNLYGAEYVWKRNDKGDHWAHSLLYGLVGLGKYGETMQFSDYGFFEGLPREGEPMEI